MKKIFLTLKTILILAFTNSFVFAEISIPSPSTTVLNQIASSMSSSVTNDTQSIEDSGNATASLIDSAELSEGIKKAAEKNGLQINTEAASILASLDTSDTETMAAAIASMEVNIKHLDDDYIQTITPDTIVYDSEWQTLTKVTGGDLAYTTNNDVFDASSPPQARSKVYVNFKEATIFADVFTKITRANGAGGQGTEKNYEIETNWRTGTASVADAINAVPRQAIVATEDQRIGDGWGSHGAPFAADDESSKFSTMKKTTALLQDACTVAACGAGNYWTVKQNHIEEYNNDINDTSSFGSIYFYGKFTTASESSDGFGTMAMEGGHTANDADEETFVQSIERYEGTFTLVGKAAE